MVSNPLTNNRESDVVYVVVRLEVDGRDYFLFRKHPKWGDWSLIGGHVEQNERGDWSVAASRETEEEMNPLRVGQDVRLSALLPDELEWGPEPSRTAGYQPTVYKSRWYWLEFLRDPAECLGELTDEGFALVPKTDLASLEGIVATGLLKRIASRITYGLDSIPYAWPRNRPVQELDLRVLKAGDEREEAHGPAAPLA